MRGSSIALSVRHTVAVVICGLLLTVGGLVSAMRASAAFAPVPQANPGFLRIGADPYPANFDAITPGGSAQLNLRVDLDGAPSGTLSMQLRGDGALVTRANGLQIAVDSCATEFHTGPVSGACRSGATTVVATSALKDVATAVSSSSWRLDDIVRGDARYLRVTLSLPANAEQSGPVQGLAGTFAVGLYASGSDVRPARAQQPLADTGLDLVGPLLIALGVVGLGLVVRSRRRTGVADE